MVQKPEGPNTYDSKNLAIAIWQPCLRRHRGASQGDDGGVEGAAGAAAHVLEDFLWTRKL